MSSDSISAFVDSIKTGLLLQVFNALSEKQLKKFRDRDEAVSRTTKLLEELGYAKIKDRDRLLTDLKKQGTVIFADRPESKEGHEVEKTTKGGKGNKDKAKKTAKATPAADNLVVSMDLASGPDVTAVIVTNGKGEAVQAAQGEAIWDKEKKTFRPMTEEEATKEHQAEQDKEEAAKAKEEALKQYGEGQKEDKTRMGKIDATTLGHIRALVQKSGPDLEAYTDDLAKSLEVAHDLAISYAKRLEERGFITLEDDSANEGEKLFCIKLTELGKATPAQKSGRVPSDQPGPRSKFTGKRIFKVAKENPRRPGTHGWKSWEVLKDGMTFEQYRDAGGRNNDLQWDLDRKWVELRDL